MSIRILHVANWYPNPWSQVEGNFIRDHIRLFCEEVPGSAIAVQVRHDPNVLIRFSWIDLGNGVIGYYLRTKIRPEGHVGSILSSMLLMFALVRHRAWRFSALHFHIATPLLTYVSLWKKFFGNTIIISEHWSAYHYNFYLPERSRAASRLRRPFRQGFPVISVSASLLEDIRSFAQTSHFSGYIIPNLVPLHGAVEKCAHIVTFFTASRWVPIKSPMPMLQGLAMALEEGYKFRLILGGGGPLADQMQSFISDSELANCSQLNGWMSKEQIASTLEVAHGYLFSSQYETFSVACAEALGAGVPLIGPRLSAIAEYADHHEWEIVNEPSPLEWKQAIKRFIGRYKKGEFRFQEIAEKAAKRFSHQNIRSQYLRVINEQVTQDANN